MLEDTVEFLRSLCVDYKKAVNIGIETNQIFMLMFSESINQSIVSDAGNSYEDRIMKVLLSLGLKRENISKKHDDMDKSTEYDFFFEIEDKTYVISAKRTLRERYKQSIKTMLTSKIDVSIEITLGVDLNEEKAKTVRSHGAYIFVSDEIYYSRKYLQVLEGVYKVSDLTIDLLKTL